MTDLTASEPLAASLVRLTAGGRLLGTGFVLPGDRIATCAHVVAGADGITADFPLLGSGGCAVEVERLDEARDIAVLRMESVPGGIRPAPVRLSPDVLGHRFRVPGFTAAEPNGVWVSGSLAGVQGAGRVQMTVDPDHAQIVPGFSGAPVWDQELRGAVGMVVTKSGNATAHLVPISFFQEQVGSERSPYLGLDPFQEADADRFHGRDAEIEKLLALLDRQYLVAVAGASGSGKSSLVRAGLIPRLRQAGLTVVESVEEPGDVLFLDQFEEEVAADLQAARAKLEQVIRRAAEQPRRPGRPAPFRVVLTLRSHSLDELVTPDTADELSRAVRLLKPMQPDELRAAIEIPAERAGLAFEAGLPEAILHDCPPGQLSLLSEVLDQLWQKRQGIWLTHEAYQELGRATGALSKRADAVLASLRPKAQRRARRLLTGLTRPDDDGYVRRSANLADLDEDLREIAHQLTAERLLTIQDNTVTLTHQALIDHWPTLRNWLAEDKDFLTWQSKIRDFQSSGALLTDAPLAEAVDWLHRRHDDIPTAQRDFISRSENARRRGQRRWLTVSAIAIALALVIAVLAGVALTSAAETNQYLRTTNSLLIAQQSAISVEHNPARSLQLALAAWRERPGDDAYGALFQQRLAWNGVDRVLPPQLVGEVSSFSSSSEDGRTVVINTKEPAGQVVVLRDLLGPAPTRREIGPSPQYADTLSPDGRWLVRRMPEGGLQLWDLVRPDSQPAMLDYQTEYGTPRFSANSRYLAALPISALPGWEGGKLADIPVRVWDLPDMRELPSGINTEPTEFPETISAAFPSSDGRTLVTLENRTSGEDSLVTPVVRDRQTGTKTRVFPPANSLSTELLGNGTHLGTCTDNTMTLQDISTGAVTARYPMASCTLGLDGTQQYLTSQVGRARTAVHWRTGRAVHWPDLDANYDHFVTPGPYGTVTLLDTYNDAVRVATATEGMSAEGRAPSASLAQSPDGRRWVDYETSGDSPGDLVLMDARGATLARTRISPAPTVLAFDASGEHVLASTDGTLRVFRTDDLVLEHELQLPLPEGRNVSDVIAGRASLVNAPTGETLVSQAGVLSFWDVRRGVQTVPPTLLEEPDHARSNLRGGPTVVLRPHHPDQVVVRTTDTIAVWNYRKHVMLREFPARHDSTSSVFVSTDGAIAATEDSIPPTDLIDLRSGQSLPQINGTFETITGISGKYLFAQTGSGIEVWDWQARRRLAAGAVNLQAIAALEGDELVLERPGYRSVIPLDPQQWFDDLCRISDREFTLAELDALPAGASTEPPCR